VLSALETRTVPERVINEVEVNAIERRVALAAASVCATVALQSKSWLARIAFGASAVVAGLRASRAKIAIRPLELTTATCVTDLQRTVTIYGSLAAVELYFLDEPPSLDITFTFRPRASGSETEVQGRVVRWPEGLSRVSADRELRRILKRAKQMIEAGEVARTDARVHGVRTAGVLSGVLG